MSKQAALSLNGAANITARQVVALLKTRFPLDKGWITLPEIDLPDLKDHKHRRADAVSFGVYGSNEKTVHCFEVKVSRSDWEAEIRDATKSLPALAVSTHFWLVSGPGVVQDRSEIPEGWGWLLVNKKGTGLRSQIEAKRRHKDVARGWLLWRAVMRFAFDKDGNRERIRREAYDAGYEQGEKNAAHPVLSVEQLGLQRIGRKAQRLEQAMGQSFWNLTEEDARLMKLLGRVLAYDSWGKNLGAAIAKLRQASEEMGSLAEDLGGAIDELRKTRNREGSGA